MKILITLTLLIALSTIALSQENTIELITDRPDQTESSAIVPFHSLQIETGFIYQKDHSNNNDYISYSYPTTLLRYGLLANTELRLGFEFLGDKYNNENITRGFGPLYIGSKTKIIEEENGIPEVAILGGLILPFTAKEDFKTRYTAADFRFAFSHTLSEIVSIGYNLGIQWDGNTPGPGYFYSGALGISITEKTGMFLEYYGVIPEANEKENLFDTGITYLVKPNLQLDFSGGIGINNHAPDYFISFGLSYLITKQ